MKIKNAFVSLVFFSICFGIGNAPAADSTTNAEAGVATSAIDTDDHTPEQRVAIKDFAFEGLKIGATYSEIKAKYPDIEFDKKNSDSKVGLAVWDSYSPKTADVVTFSLFNGKLYEIRVMYFVKTLNKIGGSTTVYDKLAAKYGKEDGNSDSENYLFDYTWQFYSVDRYVNFFAPKKTGDAVLIVADKEASRKLTEKKKANADVGF